MDYKIIIDPGHGGRDPGAEAGGLKEKDIALDYAVGLYQLLCRYRDFEPRLTRWNDEYLTLSQRSRMGREGQLFLSIHANASGVHIANDTQIYYYSIKDKTFAETLFKFTSYIDGDMSRWSRVEYGNFQVLRDLKDTMIPAVLVEIGFITNADDRKLMTDRAFYKRFCEALVDGILEFLK